MADQENAQVKETPQIKLSEVIAMLKEGKSRKEVATHYGKPMSIMSATVFNHPSIKNLKVQKERDFEIVDDLGPETVVTHASKMLEKDSPVVEENTSTVMESNVVAEEVVTEDVEEVAQEVAEPIEGAAERLEEVLEESREESEAIVESPVAPEETFDQASTTTAEENTQFPQGNWGEAQQ